MSSKDEKRVEKSATRKWDGPASPDGERHRDIGVRSALEKTHAGGGGREDALEVTGRTSLR